MSYRSYRPSLDADKRFRIINKRQGIGHVPTHLVPTLLAAALACVQIQPACAQTWNGNGGDNSWTNVNNWSNGAVPTSTSDVIVDLAAGAGAVISQTGAQAQDVRVGDVGTGSVDISGVGTLSTQTGLIGFAAGSVGLVQLSGAAANWTNALDVRVAEQGSGHLVLNTGSSMTSDTMTVGSKLNSDGVVRVTGNSALTITHGMTVGATGHADLQISGGGKLVAGDELILAANGKSVANAVVDGPTSSLTTGAQLLVGGSGQGTLTLKNASEATAVSAIVGGNAIGKGTVNVGNNSLFTTTGQLTVGDGGKGDFRVSEGGSAVIGLVAVVGANTGSSGTVVVDGSLGGSKLSVGSDMPVGVAGRGALNVAMGGTVTVNGTFGAGLGGTGTGLVTVDGVGSTLTVGKNFLVGADGAASMTVSNGASVSSDSSFVAGIGSGTGRKSSVTVESGATFATGPLVVGHQGSADLGIQTGGKVVSSSAVIAADSASDARVVVDGNASSWAVGTTLVVGLSGTGALSVTNGAHVASAGQITLGQAAGSVSAMNIANGGVLSGDNAIVGVDPLSKASVVIDGAGSVWKNAATFIINNGSVGISNGGAVSSAKTVIASQLGDQGTLNIGAPAGSAAIAPGHLLTPTVTFGNGVGIMNFNHSASAYDFDAAITGAGAINQISGVTNMTGDSSGFSGTLSVTGGRLAVNGSLASSMVTVFGAGTLGGSGTVGNVAVQSGGTIAPGNSIGTLNVNGNIAFAPGSTYNVEVNPAGQSDRIAATGAASLGGDVKVLAGTGNYDASTKYTILTAGGGRTGAFDTVASDMAFLSPSLSYDANAAYLTLTRNAISFCGVGDTVNQCATGAGVESLGLLGVNGLYGKILTMDAATARYAFDQLSGEVHASARSVLIEDSRFLREAALDRLRPTGGSDIREGARNAQGLAIWSRAIGSWGKLDGGRDGNGGFGYHSGAAKVSRDMGGLLVGADVDLGDTWRAGVVGGFSHTSFKANERSSSGNSDNYHLGIYGGASFGEHKEWGVRTGLAYTRHRLETNRTVSFPGFADSLHSDSSASTMQAFGEVGYKLQGEAGILEPFANLAHVNYSSSRFNERGGLAALSSLGGSTDVTYTTLGVRGSTKLDFGGGTNITARGTLGWAHALGSTTPKSQMAFAGGTPFTISGVPLAKNVAVVEAGLDFAISPTATLGVSYGGQFGSGDRDQGVKANLSVKF